MQIVRGASTLGPAVEVLRAGGVVAYPTDTLYGLAVDPRRDDAVRRLFDVKGRDLQSAIPLICASRSQAERIAALDADEQRLAERFWPGPLSLVVRVGPEVLSRLVLAGGATVALRVPAHPVATALAAAFGFPLTSTSANLSGEPGTSDPAVVERTLAGRIDLLIDDGPSPGGPPSTIVELRNGVPVLVRDGAVAWDRVLRSLE